MCYNLLYIKRCRCYRRFVPLTDISFSVNKSHTDIIHLYLTNGRQIDKKTEKNMYIIKT